MGGGASSAVPAADAPVQQRSDGVSTYAVKVLQSSTSTTTTLRAGTMARLAICEDELQLLAATRGSSGSVDNAALLSRFDYRAIPSWSIPPAAFTFKFRPAAHLQFVLERQLEPEPEPEPEPKPEPAGAAAVLAAERAAAKSGAPTVDVRLATWQAGKISAVLREHCYKKADEIRRLKHTLPPDDFATLLTEVECTGLPRIVALCEAGAATDEAAAAAEARRQAFLAGGEGVGPPPEGEYYPLDAAMAARLVATQQQFDQVRMRMLSCCCCCASFGRGRRLDPGCITPTDTAAAQPAVLVSSACP